MPRGCAQGNIHIVALHNHMVGEEPVYYFTLLGKGQRRTGARPQTGWMQGMVTKSGKGALARSYARVERTSGRSRRDGRADEKIAA